MKRRGLFGLLGSALVPWIGAKPAGAKVIKAVVAAKRMEALNISEDEAAAALAAPAAKKRVSKPTPKMAALAADSRPKRAVKLPKKLVD